MIFERTRIDRAPQQNMMNDRETYPQPIDRRGFLATGGLLIISANAIGQDRASAPKKNETPGADKDDWIVHTEVPNNRESSLPSLVESYITPVDRFYVRSHAANPKIDADRYRLKIEGMVRESMDLSLVQLSELFGAIEVTATMTCAGNRRYEHSQTQTIEGVPWREGAIGNATWRGYRLADVLKHVGLEKTATDVWFDGLDQIEKGGETISFGASIPLEKAIPSSVDDPGAILCTHMNGEPLNADHGAPLRVVVPGYIGARSVKWLGRIRLEDRPNPNHYQATAYKVVYEATPIEWAEQAAIYRFPINAVICTPTEGQPISSEAKEIRVAGYALPPAFEGVTIESVEISVDGGERWRTARLLGPSEPFCWQLWEADVRLPKETTSLIVRATDSRGMSQPPTTPWNKKGYLYNAQHRVSLVRGDD